MTLEKRLLKLFDKPFPNHPALTCHSRSLSDPLPPLSDTCQSLAAKLSSVGIAISGYAMHVFDVKTRTFWRLGMAVRKERQKSRQRGVSSSQSSIVQLRLAKLKVTYGKGVGGNERKNFCTLFFSSDKIVKMAAICLGCLVVLFVSIFFMIVFLKIFFLI